MLLDLKHLEIKHHHPSFNNHLPAYHPVVIMYFDSRNTPHHLSFLLERLLVDLVKSSLPSGVAPRESLVNPFILSTKADLFSTNTKDVAHDDITRWQHLQKDKLFLYQSRHPWVRRKPIVVQCPCHNSTTCTFRNICGPCLDDGSSFSTPREAHDLGIDLNLLIEPHAPVLSIPFVTEGSIIPSASLHLNELNLSRVIQRVVPEEIFMTRMVACCKGTITNKDVMSLFPHSNISASIFNLLSEW